jgi:hypothetical protein
MDMLKQVSGSQCRVVFSPVYRIGCDRRLFHTHNFTTGWPLPSLLRHQLWSLKQLRSNSLFFFCFFCLVFVILNILQVSTGRCLLTSECLHHLLFLLRYSSCTHGSSMTFLHKLRGHINLHLNSLLLFC